MSKSYMSNIHNICRGHQRLPLSPKTKSSMFSFVTIMYLAARQKKYFVPGAAFELKQNQ